MDELAVGRELLDQVRQVYVDSYVRDKPVRQEKVNSQARKLRHG